MANKILTPLQSRISYLLKPLANRWVAVGEIEGLWQGLLPNVSQRLHYLLCLSSCRQTGEGSSVLNLLCAKDQANENCEHRSNIKQIFLAGYEGYKI